MNPSKQNHMKPILSIFLSAAILCPMTGCIADSSMIANAAKTGVFGKNVIKPSGQTIKRPYKVGSFSKLEISNGFKVTYKVGASATPVVDVTMPSNYEKYISVRNVSGKLDIETKDLGNKQLDTKNVVITIKAPACSSVDLSGAVALTVDSGFNAGKKLGLDLSGGSSVSFNGALNVAGAFDAEFSGASSVSIPSLDCAWISIESSGASSVNISKAKVTNDARLDVSGASKISITDLSSVRRIEADASGASSIKIDNVKAQSIEAEASGASKINMAGKCGDVKKSESGASKVNFTAR